MAIFNEILVGRFNRSLQKLFAIKGSPPVRQLAGEIQPIHALASGIEHRYLEGWNKFMSASAGIIGLAGNSPSWRIINPIGSNVIAIIEKLVVGTVAATIIDVGFETNAPAGVLANLGTPFVTVSLDGRWNPNVSLPVAQQSVCTITSSQNTNTAGTLVAHRQTQAGVDIDIVTDEDQQIILSPASIVNIFAEAAASTMFVNIVWRERFLEDSERN